MSSTIKTFGYSIIKMKKTDQMPFSPIVHICLERWSSTKDNVPTISPQLMTDGEIDAHVKALQDDLAAVGIRAKAALGRAKTATQKIVSDRNSN